MACKNIQFLITATTNESQKGASIYLYEDGWVARDNFELLSKPEPPQVRSISINDVYVKDVLVTVSPPRFGAATT